ncbi:MAG: rod shape-determining protein MreD [Bacteroidales bacterium]|jgi:rod shape-determining protein MreD|nr:rod shape-determining protein MreD [Bacteroidales bacterium]
MIKTVIINIFRFILLIFLQFFLLNNLQFSGYVNPYLYILFILWLPFETSGWLLLLVSFTLGLLIDVSSHTIGYHTMATVFTGYLRYHLLRFIAPRDGYDPGMSPTAPSLGWRWFLKYASLLVAAHHFLLFWLESFGWGDFITASFRAVASSVFTLALIIISQFLVAPSK